MQWSHEPFAGSLASAGRGLESPISIGIGIGIGIEKHFHAYWACLNTVADLCNGLYNLGVLAFDKSEARGRAFQSCYQRCISMLQAIDNDVRPLQAMLQPCCEPARRWTPLHTIPAPWLSSPFISHVTNQRIKRQLLKLAHPSCLPPAGAAARTWPACYCCAPSLYSYSRGMPQAASMSLQ